MKEYQSNVVVVFSGNNLEAENEEEYKEKLKAQYKENHNIELDDLEIQEIEEV